MQTVVEKNSACLEEEDYIKLYFDEINRTPLLDFEEEKLLSKKIQRGDKKALEAMIKANLRLVVKIAKQYVTKDYQIMDVIQDGNLGLIKAAEKYDHKRDVRFSTYASWWIKQSIVRSLSLKKRMIRLPHRKEEKLRKIKKIWNQLYQEFKRVPRIDEIANELGVTVKEVEDIMNMANPIISFENSPSNNEDYALINVLEDHTFSPDEIVLLDSLRQETSKILDSLVPKEKTVLKYRYGFSQDKRYTLKKMGDQFGISAETVRQIEMKALKKLRERYGYLKDYLH